MVLVWPGREAAGIRVRAAYSIYFLSRLLRLVILVEHTHPVSHSFDYEVREQGLRVVRVYVEPPPVRGFYVDLAYFIHASQLFCGSLHSFHYCSQHFQHVSRSGLSTVLLIVLAFLLACLIEYYVQLFVSCIEVYGHGHVVSAPVGEPVLVDHHVLSCGGLRSCQWIRVFRFGCVEFFQYVSQFDHANKYYDLADPLLFLLSIYWDTGFANSDTANTKTTGTAGTLNRAQAATAPTTFAASLRSLIFSNLV